jgi:hypothetical protein
LSGESKTNSLDTGARLPFVFVEYDVVVVLITLLPGSLYDKYQFQMKFSLPTFKKITHIKPESMPILLLKEVRVAIKKKIKCGILFLDRKEYQQQLNDEETKF